MAWEGKYSGGWVVCLRVSPQGSTARVKEQEAMCVRERWPGRSGCCHI